MRENAKGTRAASATGPADPSFVSCFALSLTFALSQFLPGFSELQFPFVSASLQNEGEIGSQPLEDRHVNPEHGQRLQQAGDGQRPRVDDLEAEILA
jgi:hypothetical protein